MKTKLNYNVVLEKKEEETPKNFALKQSILNGALADKMSSIQNPQSTSVAEPVKHQWSNNGFFGIPSLQMWQTSI